jgi:hypothetical protein
MTCATPLVPVLMAQREENFRMLMAAGTEVREHGGERLGHAQ